MQIPSSSNKQVLNYEDVVLYDGDIRLFEAPNWLNDACVHLAFKLLEKEVTAQRRDRVLLMDPAVYNFMMLQSKDPDEATELGQALGLNKKELILIPVSDAAGTMTTHFRGSHWSLLAYFQNNNRFEHYDSMPGDQHMYHAAEAAQALATLLDFHRKPRPTRIPTPQQTNSYDCGAHMLTIARAILHSQAVDSASLLADQATPLAAASLRREFNQIASGLAQEWCARNKIEQI